MSPCSEERSALLGWQRDATPSRHCACSHSATAHDLSTKAQACSVCDCTAFDLAELRWREHRIVVEQVQP